MRKLTPQALATIDNWMYFNARHLELTTWAFHMHGGSRDEAVAAIARYQNADGGFGQAIEPDNWNPASSPYYTENAIGRLLGLGMTDPSHPIYQGIFRFLEATEHSGEHGWDFSIPSNDNYPRAPWWTYNPEGNKTENIGLTATLAGFVLRYAKGHPKLHAKALGYADKLLAQLADTAQFGEMGIGGYSALLEDVRAAGLASRYDMDMLEARVRDVVNGSIMRDPAKWPEYTIRPSRYIRSPQSPFYAGNEAIMEAELDYILDTREPDGVWPLTWSWFDLAPVYPVEHAISMNWSKAIVAGGNVQLLKAFGRID